MTEQDILERIEIERQIDLMMQRERKASGGGGKVNPSPSPTPKPKQPKKNLKTRPRLLSSVFKNAANMNANPHHEVLLVEPDGTIVDEADEAERIAYLRAMKHPAILATIRAALYGEWVVTENPRYEANRYEDAPTLYENHRKYYLWLGNSGKPSPVADDPAKRNTLYQDWLSEMNQEEIDIILRARKGLLPEGISKHVVLAAYPELTAELDVKEEYRKNSKSYATAVLTETMREANIELEDINRRLQEAEELCRSLNWKKKQIHQKIHRTAEQLGTLTTGGNRYSP